MTEKDAFYEELGVQEKEGRLIFYGKLIFWLFYSLRPSSHQFL